MREEEFFCLLSIVSKERPSKRSAFSSFWNASLRTKKFFSKTSRWNVGCPLPPRRSSFHEPRSPSTCYIYSFFELCLSGFTRTWPWCFFDELSCNFQFVEVPSPCYAKSGRRVTSTGLVLIVFDDQYPMTNSRELPGFTQRRGFYRLVFVGQPRADMQDGGTRPAMFHED